MNTKKGTTLIEVIVSIAIIGLIGFSIMDAFTTSNKVNRNSKEMDNANIKATNELEEIKKDPIAYVKKMQHVSGDRRNETKYDPSDNKKLLNTSKVFEKYKYYDYQWNDVTRVEDANFILKTDLVEKINYEGYSTIIPPIKDIERGDETLELDNSTDQYLVIAYDKPARDLNGKYMVKIIKGWTKERFEGYLYNEGYGGFREDYIQRGLHTIGKTRQDIEEEFDNGIKNGGYTKMVYYALGFINGVTQTRNPSISLGSTIVHMNVSNPDKSCTIDVINDTLKSVDFYIIGDIKYEKDPVTGEDKPVDKVNINVRSGIATKTRIESKRRSQGMYEAKVEIYSAKDHGNKLSELSLHEYKPD